MRCATCAGNGFRVTGSIPDQKFLRCPACEGSGQYYIEPARVPTQGLPNALYNATLQADIGGYPEGAIVASIANPGMLWLSIVDNNATNPDTGGTGWVMGRRSDHAAFVAF